MLHFAKSIKKTKPRAKEKTVLDSLGNDEIFLLTKYITQILLIISNYTGLDQN